MPPILGDGPVFQALMLKNSEKRFFFPWVGNDSPNKRYSRVTISHLPRCCARLAPFISYILYISLLGRSKLGIIGLKINYINKLRTHFVRYCRNKYDWRSLFMFCLVLGRLKWRANHWVIVVTSMLETRWPNGFCVGLRIEWFGTELAEVNVLMFLNKKHFFLTVSIFTQMYKWDQHSIGG